VTVGNFASPDSMINAIGIDCCDLQHIRFSLAFFVLHRLQKKTEKMAKADLDLAEARYWDLLRRTK